MAIQAWDVDEIQFPRLLAEIWAAGVPQRLLADVARSMNLPTHRVEEIFRRAEVEWDRIKLEEKPRG